MSLLIIFAKTINEKDLLSDLMQKEPSKKAAAGIMFYSLLFQIKNTSEGEDPIKMILDFEKKSDWFKAMPKDQ